MTLTEPGREKVAELRETYATSRGSFCLCFLDDHETDAMSCRSSQSDRYHAAGVPRRAATRRYRSTRGSSLQTRRPPIETLFEGLYRSRPVLGGAKK
ncbi:hypothetical protein C8039_10740 [Halogeometricum sp. wsp3]|nr:hypothetical protein C8039_10740 [Halogeometricum sp. wsp3]